MTIYNITSARRFVLIPLLFMMSCGVSKNLPYFSDLSPDKKLTQLQTLPYAPVKLLPGDELQVIISSSSPEASQFFNLLSVSPAVSSDPSKVTPQVNGYTNVYRVSSAGNITMPVLGQIKSSGYTIEQLTDSLKGKLTPYLKDPVVFARLTNFKVTVIGEVNKPVVVPVDGQSINVLEALGAAGDLTVYGIRKNVKVIHRLPDGNTEVALLDLNKSATMQSPYFQLRQNDIVYVQPNRNKGVTGTKATIWIPIVTSILYIAAIIASKNL